MALMAIPLLIENRMFKNPLENEKVPVGEHTPVRYFQSLSTYLIHNVALFHFILGIIGYQMTTVLSKR